MSNTNIESINYEKIVADFEESLLTTLRGCKSNIDFLETWVPDSNHIRSIVYLVEAAKIAGKDSLLLTVKTTTLSAAEMEELKKQVYEMGNLEYKKNDQDWEVNVSIQGEWSDFDAINPFFVEKLKHWVKNNSYTTPFIVSEDKIKISVEKDGLTFDILVDPHTHIVEKAFFKGAKNQADEALFNVACSILPGLTVQEISEHSALRLEHALRDETQSFPIKGILTPRNADPIFAKPIWIFKELFSKYKKEVHVSTGWNYFDRGVPDHWKKLPEHSKIEKIDYIIALLIPQVTKKNIVAHIKSIHDDIRVTLHFEGDIKPQEKAWLMMQLEKLIRKRLHIMIELFQTDIKDMNSKRREIKAVIEI